MHRSGRTHLQAPPSTSGPPRVVLLLPYGVPPLLPNKVNKPIQMALHQTRTTSDIRYALGALADTPPVADAAALASRRFLAPIFTEIRVANHVDLSHTQQKRVKGHSEALC